MSLLVIVIYNLQQMSTKTNKQTNSMEHILSLEANSQLVKELPAFSGTRWFITMLTEAHHWSLS